MKTLHPDVTATISGGINNTPVTTTVPTTTTPNVITLSGVRGVTIGRVTTISPSGIVTSVPATSLHPNPVSASSITQSVFGKPGSGIPPKAP